MKRLASFFAFAWCGAVAVGAPAPLPLVVNSRSPAAPGLTVYRASETVVRVAYWDGTNATALGSQVPYLAWATNSTSASMVTASWAAVSGRTGTVDFAMSPADLNYAPGRYYYEAGIKSSSGNPQTVRHGVMTIIGSPYGAGASAVTWGTNWNLGTVTLTGVVPEGNLPMSAILTNVTAGSGITQAAGDARYAQLQGSYTGTVAGVSASVVATAATNGATVAGHADTAATNALALLGVLGVVYEPTGAVARATAAAGVLFAPTNNYLTAEADTLPTVMGRTTPLSIVDMRYADLTNIQRVVVDSYVTTGDGFARQDGATLREGQTLDGMGLSGGIIYDTNAASSWVVSRLPASLLYSNSVAQTLSATAAPVSGAAVDAALTGREKVVSFAEVNVGTSGRTNGITFYDGGRVREVDDSGESSIVEMGGGYASNTNEVHAVGLLTAGDAVDAPLIRSNGTNIFDLISAGAGDIEGVTAGAYLSGGGTSGAVTLNATGLVNRVAVNSVTSGVDATGLVDLGTIAGGSGQTVSVGYTGNTLPYATTNGSAVAVFIPTNAATGGGQSISAKAPLVASTNGSNVAISYNSTPWTDYVEARIDDATVYGLYGATVVWNTEVRDAGGIHSAGTITPSSTGLVSGVANVFLTKVASGDAPQLRWQRNADTIAYGYRIAMPAAGAAFLNCPMEDYSDSPTNQYRVLVSYNSGPYTNNSTGAGVAAQWSNVRFHRVKNAGE